MPMHRLDDARIEHPIICSIQLHRFECIISYPTTSLDRELVVVENYSDVEVAIFIQMICRYWFMTN